MTFPTAAEHRADQFEQEIVTLRNRVNLKLEASKKMFLDGTRLTSSHIDTVGFLNTSVDTIKKELSGAGYLVTHDIPSERVRFSWA